MSPPDTPDTAAQDPESQLPRMTLSEHLDELRVRLLRSVVAIVVGMIVAFFFYKELMDFVTAPFREAAALVGLEGARLVAIDPGEGFLQVLKLCFLSGLVFVSPIVLWQMWGFIAAGLYPRERRVVRLYFPVSIGLFVLGVIAAYVLLIPFGFRFLIGWNQELDLETKFRLSKYLSTCITMVFGMGLIFELPLVMLFTQATGIVQRQTFKRGWKWAVVLAFVVGMVLTDPSPITQIMMALPVIGLYTLGVWGGRFVGEGAEPFKLHKAWPILVAALAFAAMLYYADELNDLAAKAFGTRGPPRVEAPSDPGAGGTGGRAPGSG